MNRKGGSFGVDMRGENLKKITCKKNKQTETGNLTFCFCFHAENPVAN